jgi:hypothetical protein
MDKRVYDKYLNRSEIRSLEPGVPGPEPAGIVVIPVLAEYEFLPDTLHTLEKSKPQANNTIVVLVINSSDKTPECKQAENVKILSALRENSKTFCSGLKPGKDLFWIDATSPGKRITEKGGVGEARKIGMDSCLSFFDYNSLNDKLFFCLDADTLVSNNYLSEAFSFFHKNSDIKAATASFAHRDGYTKAEHAAIEMYEKFMHYYLEGLKSAGSPYAFYALGSAIICRVEAYVRAGGMRARNGGEDFYFMQAVCKFGKCEVIDSILVEPSARPSDRVPFGTGPKVREIVDGNELLFYNPEIFSKLKIMISVVENLKTPAEFEGLSGILLEKCGKETVEFLKHNDFTNVWEKIYDNTKKEIPYLKKSFHIWFDAFRTLKFVHFCENNYPKLARIKYSEIDLHR